MSTSGKAVGSWEPTNTGSKLRRDQEKIYSLAGSHATCTNTYRHGGGFVECVCGKLQLAKLDSFGTGTVRDVRVSRICSPSADTQGHICAAHAGRVRGRVQLASAGTFVAMPAPFFVPAGPTAPMSAIDIRDAAERRASGRLTLTAQRKKARALLESHPSRALQRMQANAARLTESCTPRQNSPRTVEPVHSPLHSYMGTTMHASRVLPDSEPAVYHDPAYRLCPARMLGDQAPPCTPLPYGRPTLFSGLGQPHPAVANFRRNANSFFMGRPSTSSPRRGSWESDLGLYPQAIEDKNHLPISDNERQLPQWKNCASPPSMEGSFGRPSFGRMEGRNPLFGVPFDESAKFSTFMVTTAMDFGPRPATAHGCARVLCSGYYNTRPVTPH